jgi:transcriptional regulator with XRE-family HTH domain
VTTFGNTLRSFRQTSNDPERLNKRLTQERLGELIGHEMGDLGFSGAAISDWERGENNYQISQAVRHIPG